MLETGLGHSQETVKGTHGNTWWAADPHKLYILDSGE